MKMKKISTENYKGVRDFYPEEMFVENYIFSVMKKTAESFGYSEYSASILEPSELYKEKSGEEIVNEQTYTFIDRGDREVTLRPEMTPTVARMVAKKNKELNFPLRWYSIPNLFRYEKPQKGRLREHFQLNVDLFGSNDIEADVEIIKVAYSIMKNFGAKDESFIVKINNRKIINDIYDIFSLDEENRLKVSKILDKKDKISEDVFRASLVEIFKEKEEDFWQTIKTNKSVLEKLGENNQNVKDILKLIDRLLEEGVSNTIFEPTLMRGFDYYTSTVFEIFDTNKENPRSLFGGGRFDGLTSLFDKEEIPAIGFGMGDVTARDFLETHNLLPKYKSKTDLHICITDKKFILNANQIAKTLRESEINVSIDLTGKKVGDQIKYANKNNIPFIVCIGEDEIETNIYTIKELETGTETKVKLEEFKKVIKK